MTRVSRVVVLVLAVVAGVALGTSADVFYSAIRQGPIAISTGAAPAGKRGSGQAAVPGQLDAATVAAQVNPAVVDIYTTLAGGSAAGTGMVISSSGEVLTNNHVVEGATTISVQVVGTGRTYSAAVVGTDKADDVAVIQLRGAASLKTITVGDSSKVSVGDAVLAIGNALGRGGVPLASPGVVAGLNQTITADDGSGNAETLSSLIQVRALIQPGDSGGPLVDAGGNVIGMDTAAQIGRGRRQSTASNNGYAIPISTAMAIARQIEAGGTITAGAPVTSMAAA
ncbi:MAG: trypsin-like peptidase domain-containing protein [Candidatus Dormiibacterota bacterium]